MDASLAAESFCYLTTTGRRSGQPRRIEIWFAAGEGGTIYLLAGGRDRGGWVRNLRASPAVVVEIGASRFAGTARVVEGTSEEPTARRLVHEKYRVDDSLDAWRDTALPVAIDLRGQEAAGK